MGENAKRALIICVDMDDDVGSKTGLETPITGRDNVLRAAEKLALVDPEEADSNAMFASIRLSDELFQKGYLTEVSVIGGVRDGGLEASRKAMNEIMRVANSFNPSEVYVVTDGFGEEDIEPVIRAKLPLAGVKRVVVKQSRSIEASYIIFGRYLKMLFSDPRFKKWFLGLGGILIITLTILSYYGSIREVSTAFWSIIGLAVLMKGFDLDRLVSAGLKHVFGGEMPPQFLILKTLLLSTGISLILFAFSTGLSTGFLPDETLIARIGRFIAQTTDVMLFGFAITLLSGAIKYPLTASSVQDSLTILANIVTLIPMLRTLGLAIATPSFELRILLHVSLLTLMLVFAVNVTVFLTMRLLYSLKILKISQRTKIA
ncbi:MAG: DUF373 family protein [Candidatus Brockarchaeota archaeon]|nr:DUF373 family protein [Candidatus Brockarchaeota archaeon]